LGTILEKRTLAPSKLDEMKIKYNILNAFVREKAEQVGEKVRGRATAEL
jgi:protein disulfide-isomerase A6